MRDRVPTKPNRYAVYDDAHNFIRYEYHERADEPTQVGDALNKANLLPDAVASSLGLTGNPQVKDALEKIKTLVDGNTALANSKAKVIAGTYTGTGTYGINNKNSITLPFAPALLIVRARQDDSNALFQLTITPNANNCKSTVYESASGSGSCPITRENGGKTISWYHVTGEDRQLNISGRIYDYVALGLGG